jgi:hypothetical protein
VAWARSTAAATRASAEETGQTMDKVWSEPLVIRARRASPDPSSYRATAAAVQDLLVNEPLRLAAAKAAEEAKLGRTRMGSKNGVRALFSHE